MSTYGDSELHALFSLYALGNSYVWGAVCVKTSKNQSMLKPSIFTQVHLTPETEHKFIESSTFYHQKCKATPTFGSISSNDLGPSMDCRYFCPLGIP